MPAERITLFQTVEAIDGAGFLHNCVMGFPDCPGKNPCAVHEAWSGLRDGITMMLLIKNTGQMARELKNPEYRHFRGRAPQYGPND
jgi:DNA-binding IscR family transcriptional regulator